MTIASMPDPSSQIPVTVLTGFLGSGKTTMLRGLIEAPRGTGGEPDERIAVIINEFGEIGLDHDLLETVDEAVVEVRGGCLCCTIRSDLRDTLHMLYLKRTRNQVPWFDRVVIETTGLADPAPILQTLISDPLVAHVFRLDGIVTTVDAVSGTATLERQYEAARQASVADRLFLTKPDLASNSQIAAARRALRRLNPAAPIDLVSFGIVARDRVFDIGLYDPRTKSSRIERWLGAPGTDEHGHHHDHSHGDDGHHHHHDHHDHTHDDDVNRHGEDIQAFCLRHDQPVEANALSAFLEMLIDLRGEDLLRLKGIVRLAGDEEDPLTIHAVQHVIHEPMRLRGWPSDDRTTRLVFITRGLSREDIEPFFQAIMTARPNPAAQAS